MSSGTNGHGSDSRLSLGVNSLVRFKVTWERRWKLKVQSGLTHYEHGLTDIRGIFQSVLFCFIFILLCI